MAPKKIIQNQTREVLCNVVKFFESEKNSNGYQFHYQQVRKRAAAATGYCEGTIARIRREGRIAAQNNTKMKRPKRKPNSTTKYEIKDSELLAIKHIITTMYTEKKDAPTLKRILAAARQKLNMDFGREFLRKILIHKLGFKFKKCLHNKSFLIEKHEIRLNRARCLHRLQQNAAAGADAKTVVYLDETHLQQSACTDSGVPKGRYITLIGDGRMGLIPESKLHLGYKPIFMDYSDIKADAYIKCLRELLLPCLPENCIVILANTPDHCIQSSKPPSSCALREELIEWLRQNRVPFDNNLLHIQLYELIKNHHASIACVVDKLLKEHNHEVFRLPLYNNDLNPIDHICDFVKDKVTQVILSESDIESATLDVIDTLTNEDWIRELADVKHLEEEYWEKEKQTEKRIEQLIIKTGAFESDSDSDSNQSDVNSGSDD